MFIGPWVLRVVDQYQWQGQRGTQRTEYNKKILKIGEAEQADEVNPDGGFVKYGVVKNNYLLLKGSLPGPSKRLVIFRKAIRPHGKHDNAPQISYISTASKQGA